jgi:hypothetical protein
MVKPWMAVIFTTASLVVSTGAEADKTFFFKDLIKNKIDNVIVINTHPVDETLVFEDLEYVLEGAGLSLFAGAIEIQGNPVIKAYGYGTHPPADRTVAKRGPNGTNGQGGGRHGGSGKKPGRPGAKGATGATGYHAGRIELRVFEVLGDGVLTIDNNGTIGGIGGKGGPGGRGGKGAGGRDRGGNAVCSNDRTPGNGGAGGAGGDGGKGGTGGAGGNGGTILYGRALDKAIANHKIVLSAAGGPGGPGGAGGARGPGGVGGSGGESSDCGGGGDGGADGPRGNTGPTGDTGLDGQDGAIQPM